MWAGHCRKASHNASNARGVTAGEMGRNSSCNNNDDGNLMVMWCIRIAVLDVQNTGANQCFKLLLLVVISFKKRLKLYNVENTQWEGCLCQTDLNLYKKTSIRAT